MEALVIARDDFEANRLLEHLFKRADVPVGGPELELRVAGRAQARQVIVAPRVKIDPGEGMRVAPVEPLGKARHRRQCSDRTSHLSGQHSVPIMRLFRFPLPVISCEQRHDLDLERIEPAQIAVLDQILRMPMMLLVRDVHADVVQQRPVLEPFPFPV